MKYLSIISFFLTCMSLLSGCKSQDYQPETYPDAQIIFGSGGGFTGMVSTYVLLEDGRIYDKAPTSDSFSLLKKGKKKMAKALFAQLNEMKMAETTVDAPGNLYYFIEMKGPDPETYRLVWGDQAAEVPDTLLSLYRSLMDATK
ncbi:MAG: hypothetical protein R3D00_09415 [Bacteroidia bacterium]